MQRALCVAGGDICDARMAADARAGAVPDEVGHYGRTRARSPRSASSSGIAWTLTVTPHSDGTRRGRAHGGRQRGRDRGIGVGVRRRARSRSRRAGRRGSRRGSRPRAGGSSPTRPTAERFLEHAVNNASTDDRFPPAWHSVEGWRGARRRSAIDGRRRRPRGARRRLSGAPRPAGGALGARRTRDGVVHARTAGSARRRPTVDVQLPLTTVHGSGARSGSSSTRSVAAARARSRSARRARERAGQQVTETVERLDLRDPATCAVAAPLLDARWPWPATASRTCRPSRRGSRATARSSARSPASTTTPRACPGPPRAS